MTPPTPSLCLQCGYSLRGLPSPRCPECGFVNNDAAYLAHKKHRMNPAQLRIGIIAFVSLLIFGIPAQFFGVLFVSGGHDSSGITHSVIVLLAGPFTAAPVLWWMYVGFSVHFIYLFLLLRSKRPILCYALLMLVHFAAAFLIPVLHYGESFTGLWHEHGKVLDLFNLTPGGGLHSILFVISFGMPVILSFTALALQNRVTKK